MAESRELQILLTMKDKVSSELNKFQGKLKNLAPTFRKMAFIGTASFSAISLATGTSIKSFSDFNDAMTKSISIMGDVSNNVLKKMEKAALDVSKVTVFSAKQAADAYFFLASAGLNAEESIATLPKVAEFAQAGAFDLAIATDLLTDAQSALGLVIKDDVTKNMENMVKVSDVLVKANTLSNASVQQFSEALTNEAGASLKSFNIDMEEGIAVLAAFADQGVKGQVAGSGLGRIIRLITTAATQNKTEMEKLGITVFDTQGKIRNLADIISDLEIGLEGMSDEQRVVALESIGFTARIQGMILPLLGTSGAIREYEASLREAGGVTKEVSDKQLESFKSQMTILKNKISATSIIIGGTLAPTLIDLINKISPVVEKISNWVETNPKLTKVIILSSLAITGLLAVVGTLGLILPTIITGFSLLIGAGTTLVGVIGALSLPVIIVIGAVAALIAIGVLLWKNWDTIILKLKLFGALFKSGMQEIAEFFKGLWKGVADFFIGIWDGIKNGIVTGLNWVIDKLNVFVRMYNKILTGLNKIPTVNLEMMGEIPHLAEGGVVTEPTTALIGESGAEAIVPLNKMNGMGTTVNITVNGDVDGQDLLDKIKDSLMTDLKFNNRLTVGV